MIRRVITLAFLGVFMLTSCGGVSSRTISSKGAGALKSKTKDQSKSVAAQDLKLSAWTIYWDSENVSSEVDALGDKLSEIVYFAAYFDKNNQMFIPEETADTFKTIKNEPGGKKYTNYLSIVNDKINSNGKSSLKSNVLLKELFSNDKNLDRHIDDIISIALEGGYDGVEIDYEGIKKDNVLWNRFIKFSAKLHEKLKDNNLKTRIVLEPSAPVDKLKFPEGPEYVIMCYNLHGPGSKPGPKADKKFVLDLVDKMASLPGNKTFAFAGGGFDWDINGNAKAITEQEAGLLLERYSIIPSRDENSSALTFKYYDEKGSEHEVWFADGTTLSSWISCVNSKGYYSVSLWHLNGNNEESLKLLGK